MDYSCDDLTENKTSTTSFSSRYVTKSCSNLHIDSDDTSNYDYDVFLDEVNADDDYSMEFHVPVHTAMSLTIKILSFPDSQGLALATFTLLES